MQNKMHSSTSSSCNYNPITNCIDPAIPHPENDIIISSTSKLADPCSPFLFNFPNSPHMHLEYEDVYLQFLDELVYQQQSITTADTNHETMAADVQKQEDAAAANEKADDQPISRKRCSKKDRHSKINTARGPRDRRMRLSLDVARKFFDLQDLLGYDKASRTVDWLLKNSRPAIRELARGRGGVVGCLNPRCSLNIGGANSSSSTSDDCEVVSSSNHSTNIKRTEKETQPSRIKPKKTKKIKVARATVGRESRRKARERARERTSQKRRLSESSEPRLLFTESVLSYSFKESAAGSHVPVQADVEDLSSDEAQRILGATKQCKGPWNQEDYQDKVGFSHQHQQTAEFQFRGKPWETYNSTTFNLF